jgi:hypothetical protein
MPSSEFANFEEPIDYIYLASASACVTCAALAAGISFYNKTCLAKICTKKE